MPWTTTRPSLIHRLRDSRDQAAWRRFDASYGPLIVSYACRRGLSLSDAEDVRQIVLLSLVRALRTFQLDHQRGRFRSYLGRVVGNAIQRYRSRPYLRREVLEEDGGTWLLLPDPSDPDDVWDREWQDHHLRRALDAVRDAFEERSLRVFERLLEGNTTAQVAQEFAMSADSVHKIKQRVRDRLKAQISRQLEIEEKLL